jgi:hypothetical protein
MKFVHRDLHLNVDEKVQKKKSKSNIPSNFTNFDGSTSTLLVNIAVTITHRKCMARYNAVAQLNIVIKSTEAYSINTYLLN